MKMNLVRTAVVCVMLVFPSIGIAQFDILDFDATETGPWSDVELTTVTVPQVTDGAITLDGKPGDAEYGGFEGVTVTPGDNAWILDFPGDRQSDGPEDTSFTFWLARGWSMWLAGAGRSPSLTR